MKIEEVSRIVLDRFYSLAENESRKVAKELQAIQKYIMDIEKYLRFKRLNWVDGDLTIAAVDGSSSPDPVTILGGTYHIYAITKVIHYPDKPVETDTYLYRVKTSTPEKNIAKMIATWRMLLHERETASQLVDEVDILVVDGSLLGFIHNLHRIIKRFNGSAKIFINMASKMLDTTLKLIESGRVVSIVKRGRTISVTPYLHVKHGLEFHPLIDRLLLHVIQPSHTIYSYTEMYDSPWMYRAYNRYAKHVNKISLEQAVEDIKSIYEDILEKIGGVIDRNTLLNLTERVILRHFEAVPIEVDLPVKRHGMVDDFLAKAKHFNPYTNLPYINDLVDFESRLPQGFNKYFAEEVEAKLLKHYSIDPRILKAYFSSLNPQKDIE